MPGAGYLLLLDGIMVFANLSTSVLTLLFMCGFYDYVIDKMGESQEDKVVRLLSKNEEQATKIQELEDRNADLENEKLRLSWPRSLQPSARCRMPHLC